MLERLLITLILIAAGIIVYRLVQMRQRQRAAGALSSIPNREPGKALILYFTSPTCAPCRTIQRPALHSVKTAFGERVQVVTIDVTEQPEVAARYGVMTLPTTLLFDGRDQPGSVNLGVAPAPLLTRQLHDLGI